jgi:hypothetical protein
MRLQDQETARRKGAKSSTGRGFSMMKAGL